MVIFATAVVSSCCDLEAQLCNWFLLVWLMAMHLHWLHFLIDFLVLFRWSVSAPFCCSGAAAVCNIQTTLVPMCGCRWDGGMDLTCIGVNWMVSLYLHSLSCHVCPVCMPLYFVNRVCAEVRRQRVAARQQALRANQLKGLPQHALSNLSSFTIKNKDAPSTNDLDCTICQEDLCQETVASLPCGHIFHKKCISTWLKRKATCPT